MHLIFSLWFAIAAAPDAGARTTTQKDAGSSSADAGARDAGVDAGAPVQTAEVKALVDRVQGFYERTSDFVAKFRQDYAYKAFKRTQTSSGTVSFKKPGMMRWEYEKPSPKTFVLAKDKVYSYDPEAKLLTRAAMGTNQLSVSVTFLWGQGKLADEFAIAKRPGTLDGGASVGLELTPLRPDPRFKRVVLEVDPSTGQVLKSTVTDPDGSENAISFLELKANTGLDEKAFHVARPPGTEFRDLSQLGGGDAGD